jgi:hypothetical protein
MYVFHSVHQPNSHQLPHAFKFIYATHTQELLATCCFTRLITKIFFNDGALPNCLSRHDLAMLGPTAASRLMTPSLPTRLPANACRHLGPSIASHRLASHRLASRRRPTTTSSKTWRTSEAAQLALAAPVADRRRSHPPAHTATRPNASA